MCEYVVLMAFGASYADLAYQREPLLVLLITMKALLRPVWLAAICDNGRGLVPMKYVVFLKGSTMNQWFYYWCVAEYNRQPSIVGNDLAPNPAKAISLANLIGAASR